jgi:predicted nicotinamide N-methyase
MLQRRIGHGASLWDGALALSHYICSEFETLQQSWPRHARASFKPGTAEYKPAISVLEIGAGCGLPSIALSHAFERWAMGKDSACEPAGEGIAAGCGPPSIPTSAPEHTPVLTVCVTDKAALLGHLQSNIDANACDELRRVNIRALPFEFGGSLGKLCKGLVAALPPAPADAAVPRFDMVLASDVLGFADSLQYAAIVKTLGDVIRANPEAVIVMAHRCRAEAEMGFFGMLEEAKLHFEVLREYDADAMATIHSSVYVWQDVSLLPEGTSQWRVPSGELEADMTGSPVLIYKIIKAPVSIM